MQIAPALQKSIDGLRASFGGNLILPSDSAYQETRRVHNGLIDKCPAVIAQCRSAEDVVAALDLARTHALMVSVRGGGHNVGGRAVCEGGAMIDLSLMRAVKVDAAARTATAEGGAIWNDFNSATQPHGLGTTGGLISSTGVAGLTLGGGLGWLMAMHGMAVDNLVAAQIVTADSRILDVSASRHPDLFWGIRGGGGNFGVAVTLTFRLFPVSEVVGGVLAHPLDRGGEMLRFYREQTANASDELTLFSGLLHAPDGSGAKIGAIIVFHADPVSGLKAVDPVRKFGPPMMDMVTTMPYEKMNAMLDGGFPKGALNYWKSSFLETLTDEAIDTMLGCFRRCPAPLGALLLEHFHGAVTRVGVKETAFPHRKTGYNLLIASQWLDPAQSPACTAWARETYDAMRPFMAEGRYVNYLGDDEGSGPVAAAYGPNFARLRAVKTTYDPGNIFQLNQNIHPG
jgi:FAD/FMN-containing dehydrogenase